MNRIRNRMEGTAQIIWAVRLLVVLSALATMSYPIAASADDAVTMALDQPAMLTKLASDGLFTSIGAAGNRLVAVGERGRIMLSDDNGNSWRQVETPTSVTLTSVEFATPEDGWVTGQMGVVLHTSDGGLTWKRELDGNKANQIMLAAAQADLAAAGSNATTTANVQAAQLFVQNGPDVPFLGIDVLSDKEILIGGGFGMALISQDGGATWQSIFDTIPNPNGFNIYGFLNTGDSVLLYGEQGLLLKSADQKSYKVLPSPAQGSLFGGLTTPSGAVILYGLQGEILRSTDSGTDWTQPSSGVTAGLDCGIVLENHDILLGDVLGDLVLSKDDGVTFQVIGKEDQPVVALYQASDKTIIFSGPRGIEKLSLSSL